MHQTKTKHQKTQIQMTAQIDHTPLFSDADLIHSYSRAQAIEDGVLVDVSETAREAGFTVPVAITRAAWRTASNGPRRQTAARTQSKTKTAASGTSFSWPGSPAGPGVTVRGACLNSTGCRSKAEAFALGV